MMLRTLVQSARAFVGDERGELGVKGLAIMVGSIVVVGALVVWLGPGGGMQLFIEEVWNDGVWPWVQDVFGIGF